MPMVRRSLKELSALLLVVCAPICAMASPAHAAIAFAPCGDSNDFACGHLTVPLDPAGATPGTLTLALRRHRAPVGDPRSAVIALAGGPGQPALLFAEQFSEVLGPIASTRDLIVFDQRGIGLSHPLSCHALDEPGAFRSIGRLVEACGAQLGPTRVDYTSADTVADIEAIRAAADYEKLVLYGTSYGTKVAERYAQLHPGRVEALVLDSVVPPNGPDPLNRPTFAAVPRILRRLCSAGACARITAEPVADLARVVRRMRRAPLRGRVIDGHGRPHTARMSSDDLVELLLAGDFSALLRAEFVTALRAAAGGDTAPLARLLAAAGSGGAGEAQGFDTPLYFATTCEEEAFPWSRMVDPAKRIAQAAAAARALPAGALAPFGAANAIDLSDVRACAHWPFTSPAPPADDEPMPNVPTLILSGEEDLRTPTANAREVAAQIPDSQLLVVPDAGHSVLTTEPDTCARDALLAMFAGRPMRRCREGQPPAVLRPAPLPPGRLALVAPASGYRGLPGRTLHAVSLTLGDFARQLILQLGGVGASGEGLLAPPDLRSGGLRAGWAELEGGSLIFHGYAYVPGVTLSGAIKVEEADLRIGGSSAAHGTLRLGAHDSLIGTLGGRHVRVSPSPGATAASVDADVQASTNFASGRAASRSAARELARLLGRFAER
jgi:pimeloyl-ACP methyl ester carboxylesterase